MGTSASIHLRVNSSQSVTFQPIEKPRRRDDWWNWSHRRCWSWH
ncbi:hypothetical protein H5410_002157 [Solanum commersonii]|uniref:Uncharacterized protein n=1 Tax=Solanum commersonii TaxID=4109 RepID=A0A9J6B170_SOLCO|nr:hypothetical protein H5410_002157 [Solanum commersonii]